MVEADTVGDFFFLNDAEDPELSEPGDQKETADLASMLVNKNKVSKVGFPSSCSASYVVLLFRSLTDSSKSWISRCECLTLFAFT